LFRCCNSEESDNHQVTVQKHKLISKAYAKRHQLPTRGRLSISLHSTHEDPIGLNKLLDPHRLGNNDDVDQSRQTHTDGDVSSEWAAALPHLVTRRGALVPPHSSNSVSCVSEDSRRPSCDSAMSEMAIRNLQGSNPALDYKK
jgi:smoothened protein